MGIMRYLSDDRSNQIQNMGPDFLISVRYSNDDTIEHTFDFVLSRILMRSFRNKACCQINPESAFYQL